MSAYKLNEGSGPWGKQLLIRRGSARHFLKIYFLKNENSSFLKFEEAITKPVSCREAAHFLL